MNDEFLIEGENRGFILYYKYYKKE